MPYGLKYRCEFSNRQLDTTVMFSQYRFDISQQFYSGNFFTLPASGTPIMHRWNTDDPKAPVRGSSLTLKYLNKGAFPLDIFYSESDIEFQGTLYNITTGEVLFQGFLVQETSNQPLVGTTHEISITFNDGLGLLKNVNLDKAMQDIGLDIYAKTTLLNIVFACLRATNLQISYRVFSNVYEISVPKINSTFGQTRISPTSYVNSEDEYEDCYTVLEKMLKPLDVTLMQSNGYWYLLRANDARYYANAIKGYQWDADLNELGLVEFTNVYNMGGANNTKPLFGAYKKINRAYQYVKRTFNYRNPVELIRNKNLQKLGDFVSTITSGNVRYDKYQFPASSQWTHFNSDASLIVVETDITTKKEIQRYVEQPFIESGSTPPRTCWQFNDIEVNANDRIKMSLQFRASADLTSDRFGIIINLIKKTNAATIGPSPDFRWATLTSGTSSGNPFFRWNKDNSNYNSSAVPGNFLQYDNVQGADTWHTFDITSYMQTQYGVDIPVPPIPADGILKVYVVGWNEQGNEAKTGYIKDIQFSLDFLINESSSVIGQVHTQTNGSVIKNNLTEEINIDDSPRFSIVGTLFNMDTTQLLSQRTVLWTREAVAASEPLGHINAFDELFSRRKARTIVSGDLIGLVQPSAKTMGLASIIRIAELGNLNFIFGMMEINYRDDSANFTAYEIYEDGETSTDLMDNYSFTYLYKNNE